jgi:hypothetical protein
MSAKDRAILHSQQFAFQEQIKAQLDADVTGYVASISMGDYVRLLIDEGVLTEPPDGGGALIDASINNSALMEWTRNALDTIDGIGVNSGSQTPNYDATRNLFVDWGTSTQQSVQRDKYNPNPLAWLDVSPVDGAGSEAGYQQKYNQGFALGEWGGAYDSNPNNLSANDLRVDTRQKQWVNALAAANNVWGSAENYQPVAKPSWGGAGTAGYYTQAEAQGGTTQFGRFVPPTPEEIGDLAKYTRDADMKEWQAAKYALGIEEPAKVKNAMGGGWTYGGNQYNFVGNVKSDAPDLNTLEEYIEFRDSGEQQALEGYSRLMRDNKWLFDESGTKITEDNIGFSNYQEYRALSGQQIEAAEKRLWGYNTYYQAEWQKDYSVDNYEDNMKTKGRQKMLGAIAAGLLTGGAAGYGMFGTTIANSSALTVGMAGFGSGVVQDGLEGGLKGFATAAAGNWISGATGLGQTLSDWSGNILTPDQINSGIAEGADTAIEGGSVEDVLTSAVLTTAVDAGLDFAGDQLSDLGVFVDETLEDWGLTTDDSGAVTTPLADQETFTETPIDANGIPTDGLLNGVNVGNVTENPSVFNGDVNPPYNPDNVGLTDNELIVNNAFPPIDNSAGGIDDAATNIVTEAVTNPTSVIPTNTTTNTTTTPTNEGASGLDVFVGTLAGIGVNAETGGDNSSTPEATTEETTEETTGGTGGIDWTNLINNQNVKAKPSYAYNRPERQMIQTQQSPYHDARVLQDNFSNRGLLQ